MAEGGEEFGFNKSVQRVIDALVRSRFNPAILVTDLDDLSDFPGSVIADSKAIEEPFTMEVVHFPESSFIRGRAVWSVKVPHVDFVGFERDQRSFKRFSQMLGAVGCHDIGVQRSAWREFGIYDKLAAALRTMGY
jgi:hypothetical protein